MRNPLSSLVPHAPVESVVQRLSAAAPARGDRPSATPPPVAAPRLGPLASKWWSRARDRLFGRHGPAVSLQPVGLSPAESRALLPLMADVGRRLGLELKLAGDDSDIVLLDVDYAGSTPSSTVRAQTTDRPVVLVERPAASTVDPASAEWQAQSQGLSRQLLAVPLVRERLARPGGRGPAPDQAEPADDAPSSLGTLFGSEFDPATQNEALEADVPSAAGREFIDRVLQGFASRTAPALTASFGPQAALRLDFRGRVASLDAAAMNALRVRHELPRCNPAARPAPRAGRHDLDEVVWHLGVACGRFELLDQPDDAWNALLVGVAANKVGRHSRQPRHLELARLLAAAPRTPAQLQRHVRISVPELRSFVQACLYLGLVRWMT